MDVTDGMMERKKEGMKWNWLKEDKEERKGWDRIRLRRSEKENIKKKGRNVWDRKGRKTNRKEGIREIIINLNKELGLMCLP